MTNMTDEEQRWALTGLAQNPAIPTEERLRIALQVVRELEKLVATCSCDTGPSYDGPEPDCPVHGAVRALDAANRIIVDMEQAHQQDMREAGETIRFLEREVQGLLGQECPVCGQ